MSFFSALQTGNVIGPFDRRFGEGNFTFYFYLTYFCKVILLEKLILASSFPERIRLNVITICRYPQVYSQIISIGWWLLLCTS